MNELQGWCKKILPIVQAAANGEEIEVLWGSSGWIDKDACHFEEGSEYRIKPRTIKIGDIEVPEPMRDAPEVGVTYFSFNFNAGGGVFATKWDDFGCDKHRLSIGICHQARDAAELHLKALIALSTK